MKAVILSGGQGTRLRPLTYTTPKQLIPVGGRPVLGHVLDDVVEAGITEVAVVTSPESRPHIEAMLAATGHDGVAPEIIVQASPKGLADALATAMPWVGDDSCLLFLGDCLLTGGIRHVVEQHEETGAAATLLVREVDDPSRYGIVVLGDSGEIVDLVEKPAEPVSNLAIVGVYVFSSAIGEAIANVKPSWRGEYEITDAIQILVDMGERVLPASLEGWWIDTGTIEDVFTANEFILDMLTGTHPPDLEGCEITGHVLVEPGAVVTDCTLTGPVVVSAGAEVRDSSVGPHTTIGRDCLIEAATVERSILMDGVVVRSAGISRSIIGPGSKVHGQGTSPALTLVAGAESVIGSGVDSHEG